MSFLANDIDYYRVNPAGEFESVQPQNSRQGQLMALFRSMAQKALTNPYTFARNQYFPGGVDVVAIPQQMDKNGKNGKPCKKVNGKNTGKNSNKNGPHDYDGDYYDNIAKDILLEQKAPFPGMLFVSGSPMVGKTFLTDVLASSLASTWCYIMIDGTPYHINAVDLFSDHRTSISYEVPSFKVINNPSRQHLYSQVTSEQFYRVVADGPIKRKDVEVENSYKQPVHLADVTFYTHGNQFIQSRFFHNMASEGQEVPCRALGDRLVSTFSLWRHNIIIINDLFSGWNYEEIPLEMMAAFSDFIITAFDKNKLVIVNSNVSYDNLVKRIEICDSLQKTRARLDRMTCHFSFDPEVSDDNALTTGGQLSDSVKWLIGL